MILETPKKLRQILSAFLLLYLLECSITIVVLFILPSSSKNAWFFGYSKSRWMMIGSITFLWILFFSGFLLLKPKKRTGSIEKVLSNLWSIANKPFMFNIIFPLSIIFFMSGIIIFSKLLFYEDPFNEAVIVRLRSIIVLFELLCLQSLIFITYLYRQFIQGKVFRGYIIGAILITPMALSITLVWFSFQSSLNDYVPRGSDDVTYWREISTYSEVGFNGGQYSKDEIPALIEFTHFGTHGPIYPLIYGSIGRVIGWQFFSGVYVNIVIAILALLLFIIIARPNNNQLIILEAFLITFWPLWMYLTSNKQQILHLAIAAISAGLFYRLKNSTRHKWFEAPFLFIILLIGSFLRVTWSLLFIPYFLLLAPDFSWKSTLKVLLYSSATITLAVLFYKYFWAPNPFNEFPFFPFLESPSIKTLETLSNHIIENLKRLFTLDQTLETMVLLRFQVIFIIILSGVSIGLSIQNKSRSISSFFRSIDLLNMINLFSVFSMVVIVYEFHGTKDYRLFAPHFFFTLLLLILSWRPQSVLLIVTINFLFTGLFLDNFSFYRERNFTAVTTYNEPFQEIISRHLVYQPLESHWCNTIDIGIGLLSPTIIENSAPALLFPPREFGNTVVRNWDKFSETKMKARYVLFDKDIIVLKFPNIFDILNLELIAHTPLGILYENLDSDCSR